MFSPQAKEMGEKGEGELLVEKRGGPDVRETELVAEGLMGGEFYNGNSGPVSNFRSCIGRRTVHPPKRKQAVFGRNRPGGGGKVHH